MIVINDAEFRRLWDQGLTRVEMATHFGCSISKIDTYRMRLNLRKRYVRKTRTGALETDPTPEEIAERAAECRARHMAEKRREPDVLPTRKWRRELTRSA